MGCFYYKREKGKWVQYASQADMYEDFLKETSQLDSNSIFSSDEVIESTKNAIYKANTPLEYRNADIETVREFVTKPHGELFGSINALKGQSRLAPEFIRENLVLEFVKRHIGDSKYKHVGEYSKEYLELVKADPMFNEGLYQNMSDAEKDKLIIPLLTEIEDQIKIEEATKDFGIEMSNWLQSLLKDDIDKFEKDFKKFYDNNPDIFGDSVEPEIWRDKIRSILQSISDKLEGEPITNIHLVSLPSKTGIKIKSKIGILTVNTSGVASIYDFRISKRAFEDWDDSKTLTYDWELGLKRQLLGQHINIDNTRLYIIPIEFRDLKDINTLNFSGIQQRTGISKSGLAPNGQISHIAEILLPRKIKPLYNPNKIKEFKDNLNNLFFPDYKIRTEIEDNDLDLIMENAKKRFEKTGVFRKYNAFKDIDNLPEGWIEEDTKNQTAEEAELKFRAKMALYVNHVKALEGRGVTIIKDAIISALATQENIRTSKKSGKRDIILNHLLIEYLNDDWEVLEGINEATSLGIIIMRNTKNGIINIFNLSVNNFTANSEIKGLTYGDVDMMKAMYFVNEFKDVLLANGAYKLGEIITFNTRSGESVYRPASTILSNFKKRMHSQGMGDKIKVKESDLVGTEDLTLMSVQTVLRNYVGKHSEKVQGIFGILGNKQLNEITRDRLTEVRNKFLEIFPEYKEKEIKDELNFDDQLEVLYALLQTAILSKEGIKTEADFQDLTKLGLEAGDFRSLLSAIYTKDEQIYTKAGKRIQGVVGGLAWTTPEWVQSKDLRQINGLISTGNSAIGERMAKFNDKMWKYTDDFYKSIGYGRIKQITWGETQSIHADFFITDEHGKVHKDFRTKNPYKNDVENALTEEQRKYLKRALFMINIYAQGVAEEDVKDVDPDSLDSIMSIKKFKEAIEDGSYFEMPLIRREEITKYKRLFTGMGEWWSTFKDKLTDILDPRQLSQYDITNIEAQKVGFFEMYDAYGSQTKEIKAKMIDENSVDYYEFNLDTIAHRLAFSKIRKQTFDLILPTINAYMWWIKLMGGKQNKDVSKQLEYIMNQVKLAVFDEPLIGDEEQTIAKGIAFAKEISTVAMLAFRPALLAKELTIGVLRNLTASATGLYNEFGEKEMIKAYTKLITIDKKFTNEFNMIQKLNRLYRIANMDIATVPKKIQHDRHGIVRGAGRWMFSTSTAADYYNRMAIMLAKMIKDGSYEAHSMKDNVLVYDPRKDKRFEYYLRERDKYKDKDGNFTNKKGDSKFNEQRSRYLLIVNQLNKEAAITGGKQITEADLIEKAYTQQERDSIKAQSDLMYGSYDKDSQAQAPNTLLGIAFMQFMTYWPSKMRFWFGKPIKAEDSVIGRYEHATRRDTEGNQILGPDGKPIYLYVDYIEEPDGTIVRKEVEYETDEKLITWNGTPQEGLFYSVAYTIQDIVRGNWDEVKNNKLRRNRTLFALGDAVFVFILLGIIKAIFENLKQENGRDSLSGEALHFMDTVNNKVLNEYNVWDNTFGAINTEPLFLSWGQRVGQNIQSAFNGNKTLKEILAYNIGMFEAFKE